jgi:hypothetical protein
MPRVRPTWGVLRHGPSRLNVTVARTESTDIMAIAGTALGARKRTPVLRADPHTIRAQ